MKHWMNRANHGTMAGPFFGPDRAGMAGDEGFEARMAEALRVSVEQLRAAREQAVDSGIQQAVDEGELAPKQAERMQTWRKLQPYLKPEILAAQALDMTPEQLQAALDQGKSLWDLARERQVDFAAGRERFLAAGRAAVQQAVADGAISQAQADEFVRTAGQRGGPGGFFGWRGGFGPMGFGGRGPGFGPMGFFGRRHGFGPMGFFGRGGCGRSRDAAWRGEQRVETTPPAVI